MNRTSNTSVGGLYCGRAIKGVSNLCLEDMRQIEAHRAKDRPTPWAHLAARYGVNEIDLRTMFSANDNLRQPAPPEDEPRLTADQRDARFTAMWTEGRPKSEIMASLHIKERSIERFRVRLELPPRAPAGRPGDWTAEQDAYVLRHYVTAGETAVEVAKALGRTPLAVIGRSHRKGWTRHTHRGAA